MNISLIRKKLIQRRALYVAIAIDWGYSNYIKLFDKIYNELELNKIVPRSKFLDFVFTTVDRNDIRSLIHLIHPAARNEKMMDVLIYGVCRYAEARMKLNLYISRIRMILENKVPEVINMLAKLFIIMDCNIFTFLIDAINSVQSPTTEVYILLTNIEKIMFGYYIICNRPQNYDDSMSICEKQIISDIYTKYGDANQYINYMIDQVVNYTFPINFNLAEENKHTPIIKKYEKKIDEKKYKLASIERLIDDDPIAVIYFINNNSYTYDKKSLFKFKDYMEKLLERCNKLFSLCKINDELMEIISSDGADLKQLFRFVNKYKKEHIINMIQLLKIKYNVKYIMENVKNLLNRLSDFRCMQLQINYLIYLYGAEHLLYIKSMINRYLSL